MAAGTSVRVLPDEDGVATQAPAGVAGPSIRAATSIRLSNRRGRIVRTCRCFGMFMTAPLRGRMENGLVDNAFAVLKLSAHCGFFLAPEFPAIGDLVLVNLDLMPTTVVHLVSFPG